MAPARSGADPVYSGPTVEQSSTSLSRPRWVGVEGARTNPEQLFAAGYATCFPSALSGVARGVPARSYRSSVVSDDDPSTV